MSDIDNLAGDTRPIGVFDSGLGGLTVARAIATALPHESVYYFGDTKRCPYGTRTEDEVRSFALQAGRWLSRHDVKIMVIACNTATAAALRLAQQVLDVPVIGVIAPGARAAINSEPGGPGGLVTVSRKGSGHMFLKVQGKASHAGRCYADGASAILEIAHKTLAIDTFLDLERGLTVNTGLISGGTSANSVAPWAESRIHLTYRTLEDGQKVVAGIRDAVSRTVIPGTSASISGGLRLYPFERCEAGDKLFGLVKDAGELLGMSIKGQHYDSASEAGFSSSLGVPTICNMGPEGEHIHSLNEYLVPSSIVKRCKLIALTALQASRVFQPGK